MTHKIICEGVPFGNRHPSHESALAAVTRYRRLFPSLDFRIVPI